MRRGCWAARSLACAVLVAGGTGTRAQQASAPSAQAFYKGRTIIISIGFATGGTYDLYARLIARHIGRHIPGNPLIVAQSMPGAGSLKAANYIYAVAPRDGSALGIASQTVAMEEALGNPGVAYRSASFTWIGRAAAVVEVMVGWRGSSVASIRDALAMDVPIATTGPGSPSEGYPRLLNGAAGTRFKIISGYPASGDCLLALERREVEAAFTPWSALQATKADWLAAGKVNLLVQGTLERSAELPDVPSVVELGRTDEDRALLAFFASSAEIGRALLAPPELPAERTVALRAAFEATFADPEFLADAARAGAALSPLAGEKLQALVARTMTAQPAMIERMKAMLRVGR